MKEAGVMREIGMLSLSGARSTTSYLDILHVFIFHF